MKKIHPILQLFGIIAVPVLVGIVSIGCKEQERQVINKGEKVVAPEYPKLFTYHRDDIDKYVSAIVMASDGHEYFLYEKDRSEEKFEHYWNCKTCKEKK